MWKENDYKLVKGQKIFGGHHSAFKMHQLSRDRSAALCNGLFEILKLTVQPFSEAQTLQEREQ